MKKIYFLLYIILLTVIINSQVNQEWIARYNDSGYYEARGMKTDGFGNIIVTGYSSIGMNNIDMVTLKYSPIGVRKWTAVYNSNQEGSRALAIDKYNNIYITGDGNSGNNFTTVKYDSNGIQQWVSIFHFPGSYDNIPISIAVDSAGENVFVTGNIWTLSNSNDIVTIKYNSAGQEQWVKIFNGTMDSTDIPRASQLDHYGNIYVSGKSYNGVAGYDFVIIKYSSLGETIWTKYYDFNNSEDIAIAMTLDNSANVYVTGSALGNFITVKYNSVGQFQWNGVYSGVEFGNEPKALIVDINYNVYVTGTGKDNGITNYDITTVKYNSMGIEQWTARYSGPASYDGTNAITVDSGSNIYVTGYITAANGLRDFITLKYNSIGQQIWTINYNGTGNAMDESIAVSCDKQGSVYISGNSKGIGNNYDITTIKYSQSLSIKTVNSDIPKSFSLHQNYPNPFNPTTKIKFDLPVGNGRDRSVRVIVYDLLGREVATLVNEELKPGTYEVDFDGSSYSSGVYFYRLITGDYIHTNKMVLLK